MKVFIDGRLCEDREEGYLFTHFPGDCEWSGSLYWIYQTVNNSLKLSTLRFQPQTWPRQTFEVDAHGLIIHFYESDLDAGQPFVRQADSLPDRDYAGMIPPSP